MKPSECFTIIWVYAGIWLMLAAAFVYTLAIQELPIVDVDAF